MAKGECWYVLGTRKEGRARILLMRKDLCWRRELDSFNKYVIIINKLLIPRCRECKECRLSRRALHAIARWRDR